ncbi:MAG TPA: hypothetical protein VMS31_11865, partial [Pyrinomonadaceae bacterium]|nr:hypothetical protein [Pyrinomonadaceae bacterium]
MITGLLTIVVQLSVFGLFLPPPIAVSSFVAQTGRSGLTVREPHLHAPQLYADKIDFTATLTNLPGANKKRS